MFVVQEGDKRVSCFWIWRPKKYQETSKSGIDVKPIICNLRELKGGAQKSLEKIDSWFINDNYWLLSPIRAVWGTQAKVEDVGLKELPMRSSNTSDVFVHTYSFDNHHSEALNMPVYKSLGFIFLGIGAIGVFLPLLPTTPFILLAAGCFAKSSRKWHQWLISNGILGPTIKNWHTNKCISFSTKIIAISLMVAVGGYSIFFVLTDLKLRLLGSLLITTGFIIVCRIKVCRNISR